MVGCHAVAAEPVDGDVLKMLEPSVKSAEVGIAEVFPESARILRFDNLGKGVGACERWDNFPEGHISEIILSDLINLGQPHRQQNVIKSLHIGY